MPSATRTLTTNFIGKTDSLEKAFKRVNKGSALMSDKMARGLRMGMGAFAGLGAAAVGAVALVKPMVDAAADVGESLSKNRVLFGDAAEGVAQWAETSTRSFGISRREALEAVGVFGALTHAMGMSDSEGSEMSRTMVRLAGDMASFNNASPEETLIALQAGLRGEAEPLRRYGVLLDQATLKTRALAEGIITNTTKAMTPQEKALAAYSEILAQTQVQQGDFGRTSDSLANQQKILSGTFDDLRIKIGEGLLPMFNNFVTTLNDVVLPAIQDFAEDPSWEAAGEVFGATWFAAMGSGFKTAEEQAAAADKPWFHMFKVFDWEGMAIPAAVRFWRGFGQAAAEAEFRDAVGHMLDMVTDTVGERLARGLRENLNQLTRDDFVIDDFITGGAVTGSGAASLGMKGVGLPDALEVVEAAAAAMDMGVTADFAEAVVKAAGPSMGPPTQLEQFDEAFGHLTDQQLADFFGMPAGPASRGQGITPGGPPSGAGVPSGGFGGPPSVAGGTTVINNVTVNAAEATAAEIVDRLGQYVSANGPLSRGWIDQG